MIKKLILFTYLGCGTDVGLIQTIEKSADTSQSAITDTQESDIDSANEPSDSPAQLNGNVGYVNYYLRQVACPACVGEAQEITVEFNAKFFENTTASHTEWIPVNGTCTDQLLISVPSTNKIDKGQSINVVGSPNQFSAYNQNNEYFTNIYESMYDRDTRHNINFVDGSESLSFESIRGFDTIEPYTMLYVDPSYAFAAPIYRSGMTFSWTPYGSDSNFMITIAVYTPDGSQLLGYIACTSPDQGFMTVPGSLLQTYPPGGLAAIHMARHKVQYVPYQPLGGYVETHMEWEVVGTGIIQ